MKKIIFVLILLIVSISGKANAMILSNPDFETGDFTGWNLYTTTLGRTYAFPDTEPQIVNFDTNNDGLFSNAARFQVGTPLPITGTEGYQGGGIYQEVYLDRGLLSIDADIAAFWDYGGAFSNISPGRFGIEINGNEIASHEFDIIYANEKLFGSLTGNTFIEFPGTYEIRFSITAEGGVHQNSPYRYIDDIHISLTKDNQNVVPEPATLALFGTGLLGAFVRRRFIS